MAALRKSLSYANVMATVAVFLALGGGAYALSGKNSVKSDDIAHGAVRSDDIKAKDVRSGDLALDSVNGNKVKDGTLLSAELGVDSVGSEEIVADAVGSSELAPNGVGSSEVLDGSILGADQAPVPAAHITADDVPVQLNGQGVLPLEDDSTADAFDPLNMWTPADPENVIAPVAGMYVGVGTVRWQTDSPANDNGWRLVQVSGGGQIARDVVNPVRSGGDVSAEPTRQVVSLVARLDAGDGMAISAGQDNEGDSALEADEVSLIVSWLGPAPQGD